MITLFTGPLPFLIGRVAMSGLSKGVIIESFDQLEQGLKEWMSFGDRNSYDVGGMMTLFQACIENLRKYALRAELEEWAAQLSPEQQEFLRLLLLPKSE